MTTEWSYEKTACGIRCQITADVEIPVDQINATFQYAMARRLLCANLSDKAISIDMLIAALPAQATNDFGREALEFAPLEENL